MWIEYQCRLTSGTWGPSFGIPGTAGDDGCKAPKSGTFDKMKFTLDGPYKDFFNFKAICQKDAFTGPCEGSSDGDKIRAVTLTLTPKNTFASLLTDGSLESGASSSSK